MARPGSSTLDVATRRFWSDGFAAVSVRALAAEMGIAGISLYNAFGSKRAQLDRAIARCVAQSTQARLEKSLPPKGVVRAFFGEMGAHSLADHWRRGSLLVNSAVEAAPKDAAPPPQSPLFSPRSRHSFAARWRGRRLQATCRRTGTPKTSPDCC
jgi:AcrR family transcriptional regulator